MGLMVWLLKGNTTFFLLIPSSSMSTQYGIQKRINKIHHRKPEVVKGHSTNITHDFLFNYIIRNRTLAPLKTIVVVSSVVLRELS